MNLIIKSQINERRQIPLKGRFEGRFNEGKSEDGRFDDGRFDEGRFDDITCPALQEEFTAVKISNSNCTVHSNDLLDDILESE